MHVAAAERVAGRGDRARQRLALAGGHLDDVAGQHAQRAQQLNVERPQLVARSEASRAMARNWGMSRRLGKLVEFQQLGRLAQLLVVERGGLVVELGRGAHLRHRARLILVGAGAEQLPESIADTACGAGLGLRHTVTVRGPTARDGAARRLG